VVCFEQDITSDKCIRGEQDSQNTTMKVFDYLFRLSYVIYDIYTSDVSHFNILINVLKAWASIACIWNVHVILLSKVIPRCLARIIKAIFHPVTVR
jgi:hypothetical protein